MVHADYSQLARLAEDCSRDLLAPKRLDAARLLLVPPFDVSAELLCPSMVLQPDFFLFLFYLLLNVSLLWSYFSRLCKVGSVVECGEKAI